MIYTVTLNPCVDYFIIVDKQLIDTEVNRASYEHFKGAGKGLNVSNILNELGVKSRAVALLGGFTGDYIEESFKNKEKIEMIPVRVNGNNRINVKISNLDKTWCINGNGPSADDNTIPKVLDVLKDIDERDIIMICGSKMKNLTKMDIYDIVTYAKNKGARVIVDIEELKLDDYRILKPYLIKPNLYELSMLAGKDLTIEDSLIYLENLLDIGIENILLSLGKDGAILYNRDVKLKLSHPLVNSINKVGSGDAMLASFVGKLSETNDYIEALRWGGSAGLTTVTTFDDITLDQVEKNLDLMSIDKI